MAYSKEQLRKIFQNKFDREAWKAIVKGIFQANVRTTPEKLDTANDTEEGYYFGFGETPDRFKIGYFYYRIKSGSVAHKKVGLRNLVKGFLNQTSGEFDAAMVVFDDGKDWRLSFICDIKEEATTPKCFTYVFGEHDNFYRTAIERFNLLQSQTPTFKNIRKAFSVDALSDDFFDEYRELYADFVQYITGKRYVKEGNKWVERVIDKPNYQYESTFGGDDKLVRDYVKKMFGRIVFLYFLQRKGWLAGNRQYMHDLFYNSSLKDDFLDRVLEPLFFEVLNTDKPFRIKEAKSLPGNENIPYLNGGLFAKDDVDPKSCIFPAEYFRKLFDFLDSYNFTIDENDTDDAEIGIDPEMLGRIFENLLEDNKDKGAFYTPKEIVDYMCRESIIAYLINGLPERSHDLIRRFVETFDASELNDEQCRYIRKKLQAVKICDPAIGSGAFPMGLVNILSKLYIAMKADTDTAKMKRHIMEQNIYGVDIERGAVDIARLRFWLAMIVEETEPIPLPNLHFKIMQGNSLLECYNGIDLSDLTKINGQSSLFDSENSEREALMSSLKAYYKTSVHTKRKQLFDSIIKNVRRQLFDKGIILPKDTDPSANIDFFLWHTWFSDVFANGGFDIVIANPPYIDAKKLKSQAKNLKRFSIYDGTADIYTYFYELALTLTNSEGIVTFITSNKWMRNDYGTKLRTLFLKYKIIALIDFNQNRLFNATVDTNILIITKQNISYKPVISSIEKNAEKTALTNMIEKYYVSDVELGTGYWYLKKDDNKEKIKRKIENIGIALKKHNIHINYGVKAGFNDAFIVSTDERNQIIDNCADNIERERTAQLIRPMLRGRDIKRYGYDWAGLWLIWIPWHFPFHLDATIKGASERAEETFKAQYPSIYHHLCQYKEQLSARNKAETGIRYEWYALQRWGASYWEDFYMPKIIWQAISKDMTFSIDLKGRFSSDVTTFFMVGKDLLYFLAIMNSKLFNYAIMAIYLEGDTFKSKNKIIQNFHIPVVSKEVKLRVMELAKQAIDLDDNSIITKHIDMLVYKLYTLKYEDILIIDPTTPITRDEYDNLIIE